MNTFAAGLLDRRAGLAHILPECFRRKTVHRPVPKTVAGDLVTLVLGGLPGLRILEKSGFGDVKRGSKSMFGKAGQNGLQVRRIGPVVG